MEKNKPTWKATEFWISLAGVLGGCIVGAFPNSAWANIAGAILAACCGSSYVMGRSLVKSKEAQGRAVGDAVAARVEEIAKKKQGSSESLDSGGMA